MDFTVLLPKEVDAEWAQIRPLLMKAVVHGRGEVMVDDILDLVKKGQMFVAATRDGDKIVLAIAAEIVYYPRKRVLNLAFGGGSVSPIYDQVYEGLAKMAKILDVNTIQCYCRPSVAKLLRTRYDDVEEAYIVLEKKVNQ